MQKQFSIAEAKNKLPSIIHDIEKGPHVELTRRGKPVAVLLSFDEFKKLNRKNKEFWEALLEFRESIEGEEITISDIDFNGLRDRSTGREVLYNG